MAERLTDSLVRRLPLPASGNRIIYDSEVPGFGIRITAKGARSFVLNYRTKATGRERRYTIGEFLNPQVGSSGLTTAGAREYAKGLKHDIRLNGRDPVGDDENRRAAPTVADLCDRFEEEFLSAPPNGDELKARRRPSTRRDYRGIIKNHIRPFLEHSKVADVSFSDIETLHRKVTREAGPYAANRTMAVLSKAFNLAVRWKWTDSNPVKGIERNPEEKRRRYLNSEELAGLTQALSDYPDRQAANIFRLLLLTGCRKTELLSATWDQFDLKAGIWVKPGSTTKQRTDHRIPLSKEVLEILHSIADNEPDDRFVFPGRYGGHRTQIKKAWADICIAAGFISEEAAVGDRIHVKTTLRPHDLRHSYASILASAGMSLPIIGALLGHTQPATTARYSHLLDDPLRHATSEAARILSGKKRPRRSRIDSKLERA